jgi:hypothetical protein
MNRSFYFFLKLIIASVIIGLIWAIVDSISSWDSLTHVKLSEDMKKLEQQLSTEFHCQARIKLNYDEIGKQHASVADVRLENITESYSDQTNNPDLSFCFCSVDSASLVRKTTGIAEKFNSLLQKEHLQYSGIVIDLHAKYLSRGNLRCHKSLWFTIIEKGNAVKFKEFYHRSY